MENPIIKRAQKLKKKPLPEKEARTQVGEQIIKPHPSELRAEQARVAREELTIQKLQELQVRLESTLKGSGLSLTQRPKITEPKKEYHTHAVLGFSFGNRDHSYFEYDPSKKTYSYIKEVLARKKRQGSAYQNASSDLLRTWHDANNISGEKTTNLNIDEAEDLFINQAAKMLNEEELQARFSRYAAPVGLALLAVAAVTIGPKACSPDANAAAHYQSENVAGMTYEGN